MIAITSKDVANHLADCGVCESLVEQSGKFSDQLLMTAIRNAHAKATISV